MARGFDGAGEKVSIGRAAGLEITGDITIFCWFYASGTWTGAEQIIIGAYNPGSPFEGWGLSVVDETAGDYSLGYYNDGVGGWTRSAYKGMDAAQWHSCAVTGTGSSGIIYIDGSQDSTFTYAAPTSYTGSNKYIATAAGGGSGNELRHRIAEVAVWDRVLTAGEIASLETLAPLGMGDGLTFYMPLIADEDYDIVGGVVGSTAGTPTIEDHPPMTRPPGVTYSFPAGAAASSGSPFDYYRRMRVA